MNGLPANFKTSLDSKYEQSFLERYPEVAIRTIIRESKQMIEGWRSFNEFSHLLTKVCPIKFENPALMYKIIGKIGKGGYGTIFRVERHTDKKNFALKFTNPRSNAERQDVINECSLISFLDCEQLIKCEEVYDYQNRLWVFIELMEGGDLTNIVIHRNGNFSEDFCKFSLYQVALGL